MFDISEIGSVYARDQWQEIRECKDERSQLLKKIEIVIENIQFNLDRYPTQKRCRIEYSNEALELQVKALEAMFFLSEKHVEIGIG